MSALHLINKLEHERTLSKDEFVQLVTLMTPEERQFLISRSHDTARRVFGNKIYLRGLIEFTNHCKNDCYYCGIRKSNLNAQRYRLSKDEILSCCRKGYKLGFRTFVLQGGEDSFYDDEMLCEIIRAIKKAYPDCAVTLSIGEKSYEQYKAYYDAGADRYLLRHETADSEHYSKLHPKNLSSENRQKCLYDLKRIGYQTGCGFMVGSPFQSAENIADDLAFIKRLSPEMVGIGPFIPHKDTPFADHPRGSLDLTLTLIAIIRLMLPLALIPSTTALGTIHPQGREKGVLAGANVLMPNLSPIDVRAKYLLYDNKICTGEEAAECLGCLKKRLSGIGCEIISSRGDYKAERKANDT